MARKLESVGSAVNTRQMRLHRSRRATRAASRTAACSLQVGRMRLTLRCGFATPFVVDSVPTTSQRRDLRWTSFIDAGDQPLARIDRNARSVGTDAVRRPGHHDAAREAPACLEDCRLT